MTYENDKDDGYYERLVVDRAEEEYHEKRYFQKIEEIEQNKNKELQQLRDELYESLPSGDVDAFELIKIIKKHIEKLDIIIGTKGSDTRMK